MKVVKIIIISLFVFLVAFVAFYFWARQSVFSENEYSKIIDFSSKPTAIITDTFSVMTYNIGYLSGMTNNLPVDRPPHLLNSNLNRAARLFKSKAPDIIAFQEIDFASQRTLDINQFEQLALLSGYENGAKVVNWDKQYVPFPYWPIKQNFGRILSGQAILSHSKILSNERIVLPKPQSNPFYYNDFYLDRLAQLVWFDTSKDSMLIINVHFEAWDGPTRELQAKIVLDIFSKYEKTNPIILIGDFNCPPPFAENALAEKTIEMLIDNPSISMAISKDEFLTSPEQYFTFNSESPFEKIDYIFYNNRFLNCIDAEVLHDIGDISDHLPVWALFYFR